MEDAVLVASAMFAPSPDEEEELFRFQELLLYLV